MPRRQSDHVDSPAACGTRLLEARVVAGMTQRQLAFPGCTPAYISRIEAGARVPSLQILRELGRRLGVSADFLATGQDEPANSCQQGRLVDAEIALRLDELDVARPLYEALLVNGTATERSHAQIGLGQIAFRLGDHAETVERLLPHADDPSAAETLGRALAHSGALEEAIALFERSLAAAEARDDFFERVRFSVLLANALIDSASFGRASELLGHVLALCEESRDPILRARLAWSQSRLHGLQGNPELAADYARHALTTLEQTEHTSYAARAHQILAHVEIDRGRPEAALQFLAAGLPLIETGGNDYDRAMFGLERARALARLGRSEEAASAAMQCSALLADTSPTDAGRAYALVAEVFADLGQTERSIELYELAAEILPENDRYRLDVYGQLAELLEQVGRADEALRLLKQGMRLAGELRQRSTVR